MEIFWIIVGIAAIATGILLLKCSLSPTTKKMVATAKEFEKENSSLAAIVAAEQEFSYVGLAVGGVLLIFWGIEKIHDMHRILSM